mgnify:CR=1 FL=1
MNIVAIEKILDLQVLQRTRGFNTIRQEMIQELLLELQKEITEALIHNASQPNT